MEETFPLHFPLLVQSSHASLARPFLQAVLFPSLFCSLQIGSAFQKKAKLGDSLSVDQMA